MLAQFGSFIHQSVNEYAIYEDLNIEKQAISIIL